MRLVSLIMCGWLTPTPVYDNGKNLTDDEKLPINSKNVFSTPLCKKREDAEYHRSLILEVERKSLNKKGFEKRF